MKKIFLTCCIIFITAPIFAMDVNTIIAKSDDLMRGKTNYSKITITTKTPKWERTMKLESWSEGTNKSFIKINYPLKDQGTTFLKIKNDFWQYIPKIERTIKFPPSMMLQSWMGTDFTNDDLVKESSLINDYNHKLLSETKDTYIVESIAKPDAPIVWGKLIQVIDKTHFYPIKIDYYDEDNQLVRTLIYTEPKAFTDRMIPSVWTMVPKSGDKLGNTTVVQIDYMEFNKNVPNLFTLQALKNMAR
ncbi:MAG: outer membrane lipoprotein-sorting protein [Candidatus Margulisiibacteriota bacterium]|jgi:uncharacterized protein YxeA